MAFCTHHDAIRTYHRRELMLESGGVTYRASVFCDAAQDELTFPCFHDGSHIPHGLPFQRTISLDTRNYEQDTQPPTRPGDEGGETVRGGYMWVATRPTCLHAVQWLKELQESHGLAAPTVFELGAGCGVVGLFAAQATAGCVCISDGTAAIIRVLELNALINGFSNILPARHLWGEEILPLIGSQQGPPANGQQDSAVKLPSDGFDFIVASDILYQEEDVLPLWQTIEAHLKRSPLARFAFGHQERHTVTFRDGLVTEEEEDSTLNSFVEEGQRRHFKMEEMPFRSLVDDEDFIHLLVFSRKPRP